MYPLIAKSIASSLLKICSPGKLLGICLMCCVALVVVPLVIDASGKRRTKAPQSKFDRTEKNKAKKQDHRPDAEKTTLQSEPDFPDRSGQNWKHTGRLTTNRSEHTATLLPDGHVLVTGGEGGDGVLKSSEVYDPATTTWKRTANLTLARKAHSASLLSTGQVLVVGGRTRR